MRTKVVFRVLAVCLVGLLTLSVIAGVFLAEGSLHPGRHPLAAESEMQARGMAARQHSDLEDVTIVASDGVPLHAWSIHPRTGNHSTVILLHGLSDNRLGMVGYAELLLVHGFGVLMPDARAHGASGGALATYGLLEADDIHKWFDWLEQNEHPDCVFGFAESMGAAQLLQSLRSEPRFCAVAVESPFSSLREIAYDRLGQFFRTGPWLGRTVLRPVVEVAFAYGKWKYKLDLRQVSPEDVVAATTVPVLLIHGRNDSNIPVRHSRRIAARNPGVVLWEVPNADHCGAVTAAPQEFDHKLLGWFDGHSNRARNTRPISGNVLPRTIRTPLYRLRLQPVQSPS